MLDLSQGSVNGQAGLPLPCPPSATSIKRLGGIPLLGTHSHRPTLGVSAARSLSAQVVERVALVDEDVLGRAATPTLVEEWLHGVVGLQDMTEDDAHELLTAATILAAQLRSGWGPEPLAARQALRLSLLTVLTARADSPVWSEYAAWHTAAVALQAPTGLFVGRRRLRAWEQQLERDGRQKALRLRAQGRAWVATCLRHVEVLGL